MYPTPVVFTHLVPGPAGARLAWDLPGDLSVQEVLVFRSSRALGPEETEAFYAGELTVGFRRWRLPPSTRSLVEPVTDPAFFLVLAVGPGGDLHALAVRGDPVEVPASVREADREHSHEPVELVFRHDDPMAGVQIRALARALSASAERTSGSP